MEKKCDDREIRLGGMGVNISDYYLAKVVAMLGQQGTLSGTMLEGVMVNMLQRGDPNGNIRRALSEFPFQEYVDKIMKKYFVQGGISENSSAKEAPMFNVNPCELLIALVVCANFAFVYLAKEGHDNPIAINYLEKVAMPHSYAITGAMMAGVDEIVMGAGIPLGIPEVINSVYENRPVSYKIPVIGEKINSFTMSFDPKKFFGKELSIKKKPNFIPIISSNMLANLLISKTPKDSIYGFVVEEATAGGHNAPPRNKVSYGEKDKVNYSDLAKLGLPFWIGGSYANPEKFAYALSVGAKGVQLGSPFALCEESGMEQSIRNEVRKLAYLNQLEVETSMRVSPTGFPFKMAHVKNTISELDNYNKRIRACRKGGLVSLFETPDGKIGQRCSAEPIEAFVKKGGDIKDTEGRVCLCQALFSTAGKGRNNEFPIVTIGDDLDFLQHLMLDENSSYTASDVINYVKKNIKEPV